MGFGRGILERARRGSVVRAGVASGAPRLEPFGSIVLDGVPHVQIVTPEGVPPWTRPETNAVLGHNRPFDLVTFQTVALPGGNPARTEQRLRRTLVSDARDLLVETLYKLTNEVDESGTLRRQQTVIEMFWYVTPLLSINLEATGTIGGHSVVRGDTYVTEGRKYIHVGPTPLAEQFLRDLASTGQLETAWNGELGTLDADGFVAVSLRSRNDQHLILAGGSEYGTYFAVAWFLQTYAHVRWFYPGPDGTVIPRGSASFSVAVVNHIDEPDYKGRSFQAMISKSYHTPSEINDLRNWLLRNGIRPSTERGELFYHPQRPSPGAHEIAEYRSCTALDTHKKALLVSEERVPTGHNLAVFFSPYQNTLDPPPSAVSLRRVDAVQDMYPAPAPRVYRTTASALERPALWGQEDRSPAPGDLPCGEVSPEPWWYCPGECPVEVPVGSRRVATELLRVDRGESSPNPFVRRAFSYAISRPRNKRYIPRVYFRTHTQDLACVDDRWFPCVYTHHAEDTTTEEELLYPLGQIGRFRQTVAVDLARRLAASASNLHLATQWGLLGSSGHSEFCESLAPNDSLSHVWCECVPCRLSNGLDVNDGALVYRGLVILPNHRAAFDPSDGHDWFVQDTAVLQRRMVSAYTVLQQMALALQPNPLLFNELGLNSFRSLGSPMPGSPLSGAQALEVDRAALRGLVFDNARHNRHTRRILDLLNATALELVGPVVLRRDPGTLGVIPSGSSQVQPPVVPRDTLLTFHAYDEYYSPPIFEADPMEHPEKFYPDLGAYPGNAAPLVLHPVLTPVLAGVRDGWEYREDADPAHQRSAFMRLRTSAEQFCLERWSRIARQTGFYEYMYGDGYYMPRIYTARLQTALRRGYERANSRVFVAESIPHMGLDSIKFYELAKVLWNLGENVEEVRRDYCNALFGPGTRVAEPMYQYFTGLERAWANRPFRMQRWSPGNLDSYQGYGIIGCPGWITQLDYLLRGPNWEVLPLEVLDPRTRAMIPNPALPFHQVWDALQEAYRNSSNELVRSRVQYFRRAFGLVRELVLAYHPVLSAWAVLENARNDRGEPVLEQHSYDPLSWVATRGRGIDLTSPAHGQRINDEWQERLRIDAIPRLRRGAQLLTLPEVFGPAIRTPIHRYLALDDVYGPGELEGLGLGLGGPGSYSETTRQIALNLGPTTVRDAFWLPHLTQHVNWWNFYTDWWTEDRRQTDRRNITDAVRANPRWNEGLLSSYYIDDTDMMRSRPGVQEISPFGNVSFWTLKRMIVALMLAARSAPDDISTGLLFLSEA